MLVVAVMAIVLPTTLALASVVTALALALTPSRRSRATGRVMATTKGID